MLVNMFDNNDQKMGCLFYWCLGNLYAWDTIFGDFKGLFDKKLIFPARKKLKDKLILTFMWYSLG